MRPTYSRVRTGSGVPETVVLPLRRPLFDSALVLQGVGQ
jgi:hypothetical protein